MELIPILSLIILVATISTFILSVGAYMLYKIRERKGVTSQVVQPSAVPAELIAPAPLLTEQRAYTPDRRTFEQQQQDYGYEYQRQPQYRQGDESSRGPELRPTFVGQAPSSEGRYERTTSEKDRHPESKKKYVRYTNETYIEPSHQDRKQEDNLRWR
jgi:hypothetical protein